MLVPVALDLLLLAVVLLVDERPVAFFGVLAEWTLASPFGLYVSLSSDEGGSLLRSLIEAPRLSLWLCASTFTGLAA